MATNKELESYRDTIFGIIDAISKEIDAIARAAKPVADAIAGDGLVHVIGPGGHANMAVEEVFWRAGGFAAVNAILDPGTNLIHGGARSCREIDPLGHGASRDEGTIGGPAM